MSFTFQQLPTLNDIAVNNALDTLEAANGYLLADLGDGSVNKLGYGNVFVLRVLLKHMSINRNKSENKRTFAAFAALLLAALMTAACLITLNGCGERPKTEGECSCTISISCQTLLDDPSLISEEKRELIPADGFILHETTVSFSEGESILDLLTAVCRENKIHMEYADSAYGSTYIEGIGNIYQLDAGGLSGWLFKVNGDFPNYGCSEIFPAEGDVIEFVYTCDMGADVGANYGDMG